MACRKQATNCGAAALPGRCLEQARGAVRNRHSEVLEGVGRENAPARRALQQALLEQERLEDVLDRVLLLADRDGQSREADWPAPELGGDRLQQDPVVAIEAGQVHLEQ